MRVFFRELIKWINKAIKENKFLDTLKLPNIVPVFKKLDPTDKTNFRRVSLLPLLSEVFEKCMYDQCNEYVKTFLNKLLCGFRKGQSIKDVLFRLPKISQKELDSSGIVGTILMGLSKAYDCLQHDLIIKITAFFYSAY